MHEAKPETKSSWRGMVFPAIIGISAMAFLAQCEPLRVRLQAEFGDAHAQLKLGLRYLDGLVVDRDVPEGVKWLKRCAGEHQDYSSLAEYHLARCYTLGYGVSRDYSEARFWWQRMADRGDAHGRLMLGLFYEYGLNVEKDYRKAFALYTSVADEPNLSTDSSLKVYARAKLGYFLRMGFGEPKDSGASMKWLLMAAKRGNYEAQFQLGKLLSSADVEQKDPCEAYAWFSLAATSGSDEARASRDAVGQMLSAAELARAKERGEALHRGINTAEADECFDSIEVRFRTR